MENENENENFEKIHYILIGNCYNNQIIVEHPKGSKVLIYFIEISIDAMKIFENLKNTEYYKVDEKLKVLTQNGQFFFTLTNSRIFYLVFAQEKFPDIIAFEFIEELQKEEKEFSKKNYIFDQSLITKHCKKHDSLSTAQSKINEIKNDVTVSLHKMIGNTEYLQNLEIKSSKIKDTSLMFKNESIKVSNKARRNKIMAGIAIILIILFIIYLIFF